MAESKDTGIFPTAVKNTLLSSQEKQNNNNINNQEELTSGAENAISDKTQTETEQIKDENSVKNNKNNQNDNQNTTTNVEESSASYLETSASKNIEDGEKSNSDNKSTESNNKETGNNDFIHSNESGKKSDSNSNQLSNNGSTIALYKDSEKSGIYRNSKNRRGYSKNMSYQLQIDNIPEDIKNNPYISRRMNTYNLKNVKPPREELYDTRKTKSTEPPELDEFTQRILNGERVEEEPTPEQLKSSSIQLSLLERSLVEKGKYMKAKKTQAILDSVMEKLKKINVMNTGKNNIDEMISKRNELLALAESYAEKWDKKIIEHKQSTNSKIKQMNEMHKRELDEFDDNIPTELEPIFKRNSSTYIKMRSNEKHLAYNKKYDEAFKLKVKADRLEKEEEEMNYERMDRYYREKRQKMIDNYERSIVNFKDNSNVKLTELKAARSRAVDPLIERVKRLEKNIEYIIEKHDINPEELDLTLVNTERLEKMKENDRGSPNSKTRPSSIRSSGGRTTPKIQKPKVQSSVKI